MSFSFEGPVLLAGAGKMGAALMSGWLARGLDPKSILVQEPALEGEALALTQRHGLKTLPAVTSLDAPPAVIVVAVKPQVMDAVFPPLAKLAGPKTVVLSIAAGRSIASLERHLNPAAAVVRAMPNTPAAIGRAISCAVANASVTDAQKSACDRLLGAVGEVVWIDDETLIDAVTAVSGSGPAYVFYLTECLADAGRAAGLDPELAMTLARATVAGSGALLHQSNVDAATLRRNVTSPGGTTAAALAILMREPGGLRDLMIEAVAAAKKRGRELGG